MAWGNSEAASVNERLHYLEQLRQEVLAVSPSNPVLNLDGLAPERVQKIKDIALALYDAEIAVVRAKFHMLGVEKKAG